MQTPQRADLLPMLANVHVPDFEAAAQAVFDYQLAHNPLYARFLSCLDRSLHKPHVQNPQIFLPISFFKSHSIQTADWRPSTVFTSSGTTGQTPSRHLVADENLYLENAKRGFSQFYGEPGEWAILALLPSYTERTGSSLVAMVDFFIRQSKHSESGFYLQDYAELRRALESCQQKGCPTLLWGVSFALLDFAEHCPINLEGVVIMETGGMKGRRQEITRTELHGILQEAFGVRTIHSEYGMTELFSQAYSQGNSVFWPASTMRVFATEMNDPFCFAPPGRTGILNIIDLANLDTCSFIRTEDLGRVFPDGSFEVLGRADDAELRGCNLLLE